MIAEKRDKTDYNGFQENKRIRYCHFCHNIQNSPDLLILFFPEQIHKPGYRVKKRSCFKSISNFLKIGKEYCSTIIKRIFFLSVISNSPGLNIRQKCKNLVMNELRANTSPFKASASLSTGVFMAIMPIHGFQVISLIILTFVLRLNRPLALLGVTVSSAPLLPFWVASGIGVGKLLIPQSTAYMIVSMCKSILPSKVTYFLATYSVTGFYQSFIQWFLGSIILAVMCGMVVFTAAYPLFKSLKSLNSVYNNNKNY